MEFRESIRGLTYKFFYKHTFYKIRMNALEFLYLELLRDQGICLT